jgi:hypothetical protein
MKIVARMSEAISGGGARVVPDVAALIRATSSPYPEIKKADRRPAILQIAPGVGSPGGAEHSTRAKIHFFFDFLAFFALAFFAFFAFLAIVSSQGFHGLKRDTEACLAEGQPRNILDSNPNRFAARCRVLSRRRHHVIHR